MDEELFALASVRTLWAYPVLGVLPICMIQIEYAIVSYFFVIEASRKFLIRWASVLIAFQNVFHLIYSFGGKAKNET